MTFWTGLILGLIIGWVVEWIIDWLFWRRRRETDEAELRAGVQTSQSEAERLRGQLSTAEREAGDWRGKFNELVQDCQARVSGLEATNAELRADWESRVSELEATNAELQAQLKPVDTSVGTQFDMAPVVAEATEEPDMMTRTAGLTADVVAPERRADDLTRIRGIGKHFAEKLRNGGITTFSALAQTDTQRLSEIAAAADWQKVDYDDWKAQAAVLAQESPQTQMGDDLLIIEGIGPRYDELLREQGITTFIQLAESDEATLAGIINAPTWRKISYDEWIAQAKLAAAGDKAGLKELQDRLNRRS